MEKNLVKGFVENIPWQHRCVKDQNVKDWKTFELQVWC